MRLFLLTRGDYYYDENTAIVVRARDEQAARALAASARSDEDASEWLNADKSTCVIIPLWAGEEVILIQYHNG